MARLIPLVATLAALAVSACATGDQARAANDPLEPLNRGVYRFNVVLDDAVVKPGADVYRAVTPSPAREGVRNFMNNLNQPVVAANVLLQGDPEGAARTAARFGLNTTIGVFGLFDVATRAGLPARHEDFGQTLAVWGVPEGPYLMLPVFGPSNLRDGAGRIADRYPHPLQWNEEYSDSVWAWSIRGVNGVDWRARAQGALESLDRTAIDPYVQLRSAYRQRREADISERGNGREYDDLPDFED